ncbi:alkaline phosphatase [Sandaracinobacteroides hominis]|uniref:alkaline phosphatase n=1 Tax=Sandaracinobacteroides hominis TaxID=2780086 RepID=UPI001F27F714|nr:alkaline phosphatase [Sandaracinobacteroides hominis]
MKKLVLAALLLTAPALAAPLKTTASAEPTWKKSEAELAERLKTPGANARAKNVILIVGDGMGISTITAARIYEAQKKARAAGGTYPGFEGGEENLLSFERLPNRALVKTYNTNAQVPDSAGTASAMTNGAKTRIGVLGINPGQGPQTCATPAEFPTPLARLARDRGMGVGIVTTTRVTHATPAAMYAHAPSRDWEGADRDYGAEARKSGCPDIASQLIAFPGGMDVVLGGGLSKFRPRADEKGAGRDDGRDLIAEWQKANPKGSFVAAAPEFRALDPRSKTPVIGLFNASHLDFAVDADRQKEPSLAELATFAVRKLQSRPGNKGYVLMIEGGKIDHGHHLSNAYRALDETAELSEAVAQVLKLVDLKDTLVLVTADHSHVFTMAGYPPRGNDILGLIRPLPGGEGGGKTDEAGNSLDQKGRTMPTLGYANGPAEVRVGSRVLNSDKASTDPDFLQPKTFQTASESHGGEDVALFAGGPGSALASGTIEQSTIFHIMAHALGWE